MYNIRLFKNKYRKESLRLNRWDYSWPGYYFVTICVKNRKDLWFGKIKNGKMKLNVVGKEVKKEWKKTEEIRKDVKLDCFSIMPNHLHGIIVIENNKNITVETPRWGVSSKGSINKWNKNSLGSIINQFKSICTKRIRNKLDYQSFQWQPRYYEHIIRTERSLEKIRNYIQYNPDRWDADRNNPMSKKFRA